ncbi:MULTISPECIES: hypothetical protein [unclassified Methylobacterium]|uniref:hypothetical protein n=2 Tax=Methylobacterium TaxID=407 RepID=UPI000CBA145C|nr:MULTISPECIES: hypothetical protein [unclassified Methylobacterium]PIU12105.1 MAG: hypothetical protein COT28_16885 [Methylobacterium sp. CG08_land_8_20_14_0_20_71_15]GBU19685.1 hypothetical protein AwMethylo_39000 [Methylobacterium sp.]
MTQAIDKSKLFRSAWQIARHTAMGLDLTPECARQFFGAALRRAWREARAEAAAPVAPKTAKLLFLPGTRRYPVWLARITGRDPRFGLAREFLRGTNVHETGPRVIGPRVRFDVELVEGAVFQDQTKDFYVVRDGELVEVRRHEPAYAAIQASFA